MMLEPDAIIGDGEPLVLGDDEEHSILPHNIAAIRSRTERQFGDALQTARGALALVMVTRKAAMRTRTALSAAEKELQGPFDGVPREQWRQISRELNELLARLDVYVLHIAQAKPAEAWPDAVRPLVENVSSHPSFEEVRHSSPDFLTPFVLENQLDQLGPYRGENLEDFVADVGEAALDVSRKARAVVKKTGETLFEIQREINRSIWGSPLPWVLGAVAAVAVAGGVTYLAIRR